MYFTVLGNNWKQLSTVGREFKEQLRDGSHSSSLSLLIFFITERLCANTEIAVVVSRDCRKTALPVKGSVALGKKNRKIFG